MASPESSLHVKSPQISSQRLFHLCLPFKTPKSLKSSFADLPGNGAWINTWALTINGRFAWREVGCSTGGGFPEVCVWQEHRAISSRMDRGGLREALPIMGCWRGERRLFLPPRFLFPCSSRCSYLGVRFSQLACHFTDEKIK